MSEKTDQEIIKETILKSVGKAASTSVDGTSVTNRSIDEMIKAADYIDRRKAASSPFRLAFARVIPPNALGE